MRTLDFILAFLVIVATTSWLVSISFVSLPYFLAYLCVVSIATATWLVSQADRRDDRRYLILWSVFAAGATGAAAVAVWAGIDLLPLIFIEVGGGLFFSLLVLLPRFSLWQPPDRGRGAARATVAESPASARAQAFLATVLPAALVSSVFLYLFMISLATLHKPAPRYGSAPFEPPKPVYNAIADPNGGEPDILLHGVPTQLFFNLGPLSMRNMIAQPGISERLAEQMKQEDTLDLAVTMTCHVCATALPQTRLVRYVSAFGTSTVAVFYILPDLDRAEQRNARSLSFSIDRNGIEFDFLNVSVRIKREGSTTASRRRSDSQCTPNLTDPEEPRSDLIIRVSPAIKALKVSFTAPDPELTRRLVGHEVVAPDGSPKFFKTSARTPDAVTLIARNIYFRLKALVEQQQGVLKQLPDVGPLDRGAQVGFDPASKKEAVETLHELGSNMYDTLFYSRYSDPELREILDTIERYGDERRDGGAKSNLRILIYSDATYLPWQLLHPMPPGGEVDATQFWGNKYILGVIPTDPERDCGRLPGAMKLPAKNAVLYAHYWQTPPFQPQQAPGGSSPTLVKQDTVSLLGEKFAGIISRTLGDGVSVVRSKAEFTDRLKADRRDVLLLWSFTHGHSGDTFVTVDGKPIIVPEVADQRLDFSQSEFISAYEIKTLTIDGGNSPFFAGRPFVFLNGCETGTQGARGTTDFSLPGIFLMRGARGVVATEAPVWAHFGYHFGVHFLNELAAGKEAGEAMLATRRWFLDRSGNPLGLLYSYYGNPAVRLARSGS
jgi:hypothetical protein